MKKTLLILLALGLLGGTSSFACTEGNDGERKAGKDTSTGSTSTKTSSTKDE